MTLSQGFSTSVLLTFWVGAVLCTGDAGQCPCLEYSSNPPSATSHDLSKLPNISWGTKSPRLRTITLKQQDEDWIKAA